MARFTFSLDKVLRVREHQLKFAQVRYASAAKALEEEEQILTGLHQQQVHIYKAMETQTQGAWFFQCVGKYAVYNQGQIATQKNIVFNAQKQKETCQKGLVNAKQNREMMKRLEDIAYQRHSETTQRIEQSITDEVAQRIRQLT